MDHKNISVVLFCNFDQLPFQVCKVHSISFHRFDIFYFLLFISFKLQLVCAYSYFSTESITPIAVPPAYYAHLAAFRARYYIEGETSDGGSTGGENRREFRPLPLIKDNVKEVMFYC